MRHLPLLVAAAVLAAVSAAEAQEEKPRLDFQEMQTYVIDGQNLAYFRGIEVKPFRMEVKLGDVKEISLRADRAIVWIKSLDDAKGDFLTGGSRVYAEGNVLFMRRDVQSWKVEVFRAERFYLDLQTRAGYFEDVLIEHREPDEKAGLAVVLRAQKAQLAAGALDPSVEAARTAALGLPGFAPDLPGRLKAFDIVLSTCTFGDPHYHIGLSEAQVDWRFPGAGRHALAFLMGKPENAKLEGRWVTFNIWGIPVFAWPSFSVGLGALTALPLERVKSGKSSRFGNSIETTWGVKIDKGLIDSLNPFDDGNTDDDGDAYGRLRWQIDWRQKRGWAGGIDPSWGWGNYTGYIDSYYMRDEGPDPGNDFDAQFLPLERTDRGRIRGFHRVDHTQHFRSELEASWLSDRNILEEMFEEEFKEGKEQETVGYLRYLKENQGAFAMQKMRINDFQTQLEFLPKVKGFLTDHALVPELPFAWNFSEELEIVQLRQKFDDDLGLSDVSTWRLDSLSSWVLSVPLGVATLSPFAEARVTAWENALDEDPADRFIATAGVRVATDVWGDHDVDSEFLGIHKLRHIIHLEARAISAFASTLDPSELFQYDAVDGFDKFTEISFEFRNTFQTKIVDGEEFRKKNFLDVGLEMEYYPDSERDTVGFKSSNFTYPFNWITLGPSDPTGVLEKRSRSNIHWDVTFRPSNYLEAKGMGEYNPVHNQEEVREYSVAVLPKEGLSISVGQVFVFDVTNAFTLGLRWDLTEKWRVTGEIQYDFKTGDFINEKAAVSRDFHDFHLQANFEEDAGRDERRFYITIEPSFLKTSK